MNSKRTLFIATATALATMATPLAVATPVYAAEAPAAVQDHAQVQVQEGYMTSTDGKGTKIWWKSQTQPNARGTVVVIHGAAEHSGRYDYVSNRLLDAGYNVYRLDHRGHGKSALPELGNAVVRGHIDDFHYLVDDMNQLVNKAKSENPGMKTFMLGHSMGALAAQFYGIKYPGQIDAFVTNGGGAPLNFSGVNNPGQTITPEAITETQRNAQPSIYESLPFRELTTFNAHMVNEMIPGRRDIHMPSPLGSDLIQVPNAFTDGVASDPAVTAEYQTDPLVNKKISLGMAEQMAFAGFYDAANADLFTAPTLIMHGSKDGLVPPYFAQDWYNAIGSADKELIYWEGQMHEVLNEPAKHEAMDKVIDWLNAH
ncbi:alpha/beta hydrolase [Corynebacterium sp. TAE3-ERU2]|uniref:alpha/beta hydrolase n=1 Tax=Corynebacterium sp. TAE3-ERU2 TaxID=2849497 RepID=UPI001C450B1C|nr:alpha/beta hydrolase [Corynebacterium sp. TAE3-ERU2]MBV7303102.1 lysophospholipase [Corynebacterium sp. TAE3-ERU2]